MLLHSILIPIIQWQGLQILHWYFYICSSLYSVWNNWNNGQRCPNCRGSHQGVLLNRSESVWRGSSSCRMERAPLFGHCPEANEAEIEDRLLHRPWKNHTHSWSSQISTWICGDSEGLWKMFWKGTYKMIAYMSFVDVTPSLVVNYLLFRDLRLWTIPSQTQKLSVHLHRC